VRRPLFTHRVTHLAPHPSPSGAAALVQRGAAARLWWCGGSVGWRFVECRGARGLTAGSSGGEHRGRGAPAGAARRPAAKVNIAINKEITACKDVQDLCSLIQNRVIEFNHVNVATAFRKLLLTPRHGVARGTVDQGLRALEESALHNIGDFGPQALANTLHAMAMAKAHYTPTNILVLEALEGRAEAVAGTFNAQGVANTLWAYARMGREPGDLGRKPLGHLGMSRGDGRFT
jgi:hypothetical protein